MSLPTGSGLTRAYHCPASCALPRVHSTSEDADTGTARHRFLELVGDGWDPETALEQIPEEHREACAQIDLEGLPLGDDMLQEVTFTFDLETGNSRQLGRGLKRNYGSATETEIVGTIDVVGYDQPPERVRVIDYKFDGWESHCPPVARNHQIRFAALCAARTNGSDSAQGELIHFRSDGTRWHERAHFDALELDVIESELHDIADRVQVAEAQISSGYTPTVSRGEWCRYCPAMAACPAVVGLIRAAAGEPEIEKAGIMAMLTPETAAVAYRRLKEIEEVVKFVKTQLHLFAEERPIDLGDGQVYGRVSTQKKIFDARKARQALAEEYGPEVAEAACDFETSAAAIERAIRPVYEARRREAKEAGGKRVTVKAVMEEALAAVQEAGAISVKESFSVKEHRAERPALMAGDPPMTPVA